MTSPALPAHPVTIVTGAGSGIGRATAVKLATLGHRLVLVGRTASKLDATAEQCTAARSGCEVLHLAGDLADSGFAHGVVDRTIEAFGELDVLVNCAGVAPHAPIERTTEEVLEEAFLQNTFGAAFLITRAWPHFKDRRAGCIVNVSTLGSIDPFHGFFAYAASKAAIDSFTRSAHVEGHRLGIRAFCVNPGAIETPLLRKNFNDRVVPPHAALPPEAVADVIVDCIAGNREADRGKVIVVKK